MKNTAASRWCSVCIDAFQSRKTRQTVEYPQLRLNAFKSLSHTSTPALLTSC